MANTINIENVLSARVAYLLEEPTAFEEYANTTYQWELNEQWDTVTVQNFPQIDWDIKTWTAKVQTKAWENISVKDWALGRSEIKVDQVANINIKIKDIEKALSNLDLESWLAKSIARWAKRVKSNFIRDLAIENAGNSVWDDTTPITVTNTNVFKTVMDMGVKIDNENAPGEWRALFASPDLCALMVQSPSFDATSITAEMRKRGFIWEYGWFMIIKDTTLPLGVAVAMDKNSVHFISKLTWIKHVGWETNNEGFFWNILGEIVYGGNVLGLNKGRICTLYYTVA